MPDIDAILQPPAREFHDEVATEQERARIDELIDVICCVPEIDDALRFPFNPGDEKGPGAIYNDGQFWLTYRKLNEWTIEILGIGTVEDAP